MAMGVPKWMKTGGTPILGNHRKPLNVNQSMDVQIFVILVAHSPEKLREF